MPLGSKTLLRFSVTRSFPVRRSIAVESRDADLTRKRACLIGEDCCSSFEGAGNQDPICPVESGVTHRQEIVRIGLVVRNQLSNYDNRTV